MPSQNYLLFGHILKCSVIPKEQVHKDLFKGSNKRFKVSLNFSGRNLSAQLITFLVDTMEQDTGQGDGAAKA
jgi:nucleolar protein 15